jgi:hypothetical protein
MIDPMLIAFSSIALPVVLVPVILGFRQERRKRELEHTERIKALELGRILPTDESWWTLPRISVAIGVGVPAAVFFCAGQASASLADPEPAWVAAGLVGVAAVLSGSILAGRHCLRREELTRAPGYDVKPLIDADEYDVVSRRG